MSEIESPEALAERIAEMVDTGYGCDCLPGVAALIRADREKVLAEARYSMAKEFFDTFFPPMQGAISKTCAECRTKQSLALEEIKARILAPKPEAPPEKPRSPPWRKKR